MKKTMIILSVLILLMSGCSASETNNESGLYALTFNTAKFDECAKNDLALHLLTYYDKEYLEIRELLKLGKGIHVFGKDIPTVLYPVWIDNKIVGVFNVIYYGGVYSGSYSGGNSEQLTYAIGKTNPKQPLKLLKTADGFYYVIGNDIYSMTGNPGEVLHNISIIIELFQKTFLTNGKVVNVKETLEYTPITSDIEFLE